MTAKEKSKKVYLSLPYFEGMPKGFHDENEKYLLDAARIIFREPDLKAVTSNYKAGRTRRENRKYASKDITNMLDCDYVIIADSYGQDFCKGYKATHSLAGSLFDSDDIFYITGNRLPNPIEDHYRPLVTREL